MTLRNVMEYEGLLAHLDQQEQVLLAVGEGDLAPLMKQYGHKYVGAGDTYRANPKAASLLDIQTQSLQLYARRSLAMYQHYMTEQTALFEAGKEALAAQGLHGTFDQLSGNVPVTPIRQSLLDKADLARAAFTKATSQLLSIGGNIDPLLEIAQVLTLPDKTLAPVVGGDQLLEDHIQFQDRVLDRMGDLLVRQILNCEHELQQTLWEQLLRTAEHTLNGARLTQALLPDATPDMRARLGDPAPARL